MTFLEKLDQLDKQLLLFLNGLHHPFLDDVMWYVSLKYTWIPIYLGLIFIFYKLFGVKHFWKIVVGILIAVGLSDYFASGLCKPFFERFRPSHSPEIQNLVHILRDYRGGKYGFISSHASTTFSIAWFVFLSLKRFSKKKWVKVLRYASLVWAALVAYSRVYLGVHYVGDILAGAVAGILMAWLVYWLYTLLEKRFSVSLEKTSDSFLE
ncbi:phosphatase PAP2 family protein [Bernardetia sp.]|uniref:phosphatase PAP2 family protein n=1 Tax=Bernardetia sp. TaxID=1937974 RepID=UPI0025C04D05|nr:phosphatase PAP2 family protein [Bernardetia sp.]